MNGHRTGIVLGVMAAALACSCGPRRVTTAPPPPPATELFVLLPDADNGAIGRASVSTPSGTVELIGARSATEVAANRAPAPPRVLEDAEVQRVFGDALAALPLPPAFFNLYFKFNSDELTDESRALLPEVLKVVAGRPAPDVVVVGHTDTTGASNVNFELGLK